MKINASKFEIDLQMPNSYYTKLFNQLTKPELMLKYNTNKETRILRIPIANSIPYRTLTYPYIRTSPEFYNVPLPVRTQTMVEFFGTSSLSFNKPATEAALAGSQKIPSCSVSIFWVAKISLSEKYGPK